MTSADLLEWAMKLGFPAALAAFLIWQNYKQQARLVLRLTQSEDWIRETLVQLSTNAAATVRDNTAALRESARVHRQILDALAERPCMIDCAPGGRSFDPHPMPPPPAEPRRPSGLDVGRLRHEESTEVVVKPPTQRH